MLTRLDIFHRYQAIQNRLPNFQGHRPSQPVASILDVLDTASAFVFDAFGVLNLGEHPIPGAAQRLQTLREAGIPIRILTNAASQNHQATVAKFRQLGIDIADHEIISSRDAALAQVPGDRCGCIAATADRLDDIPGAALRLESDAESYQQADSFLFLSTSNFTPAQQQLLEAALHENPRPLVVANADLAAPRGHDFSLEPGYFGHELIDQGVTDVRFFGKPFGDVYARVEKSLPGIATENIVMCGDSLHTDILGAGARGWQTALIYQDGLCAGLDIFDLIDTSGITPHWVMPRI